MKIFCVALSLVSLIGANLLLPQPKALAQSCSSGNSGFYQNSRSNRRNAQRTNTSGQFAQRPQFRELSSFCPQFSQNFPPATPFNGSANSSDAESESISRWALQRLPLRVFVASGAGIAGYRSFYRDLAIDSLSEWSQTSQGKLQFQLVSSPNQADITIGWTSEFPGSGAVYEAGNTVTTTSTNPRTGSVAIEHAQITILTQIRGASFTAGELKKIALHEIGHAIGINMHSQNPVDIMFAVTSPAQRPMLTAQDVATANQIYRSYPIANLP